MPAGIDKKPDGSTISLEFRTARQPQSDNTEHNAKGEVASSSGDQMPSQILLTHFNNLQKAERKWRRVTLGSASAQQHMRPNLNSLRNHVFAKTAKFVLNNETEKMEAMDKEVTELEAISPPPNQWEVSRIGSILRESGVSTSASTTNLDCTNAQVGSRRKSKLLSGVRNKGLKSYLGLVKRLLVGKSVGTETQPQYQTTMQRYPSEDGTAVTVDANAIFISDLHKLYNDTLQLNNYNACDQPATLRLGFFDKIALTHTTVLSTELLRHVLNQWATMNGPRHLRVMRRVLQDFTLGLEPGSDTNHMQLAARGLWQLAVGPEASSWEAEVSQTLLQLLLLLLLDTCQVVVSLKKPRPNSEDSDLWAVVAPAAAVWTIMNNSPMSARKITESFILRGQSALEVSLLTYFMHP
jgi:hypothetical protein